MMAMGFPIYDLWPWSNYRKFTVDHGIEIPEGRRIAVPERWHELQWKNVFTSSDPHPDKSFCHNFWRIIWKYVLYKMVYTFWHSIPAFYLTFLSGILSGIYSDILFWPSIWYSFKLAVEIWQCPLRSGARGWGPVVPTEIWSSRLKSGSAHWDLEPAAEVQQEEEGEEEEEGGEEEGGGGGGSNFDKT